MNRHLPAVLRAAALGALSLSAVSCVDQSPYYQPDGNVFITDRPPRYGYRGTHTPNYNQGNPGSTATKPPAGESAADLHKKENTTAATDTTGTTGATGSPPPTTETKPADPTGTTGPITPPPAKKGDTNLPYGTPVIGKKGFVYSPYAPEKGMVDVTDIPSGTKVECPYTQKIFRVP